MIGPVRGRARRWRTMPAAAALLLVLGWHDAPHAQLPQVGILALFTCDRSAPFYAAMRELGHVEGQTVAYDCVLTLGRIQEVDQLARDMVARSPAVLMTSGTPAIRALQRATSTIPIVMQRSADAVREGLVESLARPGGNTTGLTSITIDLLAKRLEMAREALPSATRLALLNRRGGAPEFLAAFLPDLERAGHGTGFSVRRYQAADAAEARTMIAEIAREGADVLYVVESPSFSGPYAADIARAAAAHALPIIGANASMVRAGGLFAYAPADDHGARLAAQYVDRILRGAKPADLPVQQPSRFTLTVNLATARTLGIELSPALLARADEVIE